MKKQIKTALCAALGAALLLSLCACGAPAAAPSAEVSADVITVSASGTVRLVPDKAVISFGVSTQEATAELAQSKNSEAVDKVIETLTARGVDEKSIRTTNYSMYPQYDYSEYGEQRLVGYFVITSLSIQDQDIDQIGKLLSDCVAAGINRVDQISFLCSGYDEAYRQALAEAVEASRVKAEALAQAAGRPLGAVASVTEGWQDTSARYGRAANVAMDKLAAEEAAAPSFMPGETEISANVTVSYRLG